MTVDEIQKYLGELNEELGLKGIKVEISLFGGAMMCLALRFRHAKDVDAIFEPVRPEMPPGQ